MVSIKFLKKLISTKDSDKHDELHAFKAREKILNILRKINGNVSVLVILFLKS